MFLLVYLWHGCTNFPIYITPRKKSQVELWLDRKVLLKLSPHEHDLNFWPKIWKLTESSVWCGLQPVMMAWADRKLQGEAARQYKRPAVTGDGRVGVTRCGSPLSPCISRVSPGWSWTTGPLLPTFSQLSHEVTAEDKVCESQAVQAWHASATCVGIRRPSVPVLHVKLDAALSVAFSHGGNRAGVGQQEMMLCWI